MKEIRLRVLATSDLHMQIMAFDYVKDRPSKDGSLAKLATLIKTARAEALENNMPCLLLDNGDTLQGTPLGDLLALKGADTPHPMVRCMTHLGYDAGGLGNHDFDHGLPKLASYLGQHTMSVVCSNLIADCLPTVQKSLILEVSAPSDSGCPEVLRVGVLSSLPDKTALWSRHHVAEQAIFHPPLPILSAEASRLREQGADVVLVLAHMGLALFEEGDDPQNQISEVAAIKDVDAVIGGHTHLRFPGPEHESIVEADCAKGQVHGKPVVQPGASAADLGVMDLTLQRFGKTGRWYIVAADVSLRPATRDTPEDGEILSLTADTHIETRRYLSQPVAHLQKPMNSFFALAHPSPIPALMAAAKQRAIAQAVTGTRYADLPLVAVASAPLTGGFDGPGNFLHLASGQINRQHVAGMNPYTNHVWAVKTTGAQLRDWLERSALIFNTLEPDSPDQMLVDPRIPGFRFDTIYGLTYRMDLRNPPMFDTAGKRNADRDARVRDICWKDKPLDDEQEFLVATTDHRAGGGGLYKTFDNRDIVVQGHAPLQEAVLEYLKAGDGAQSFPQVPWAFAGDMNRTAVLLTTPDAQHHLDEIADLKPVPCGETRDGFLRLRLHL